MQLGAMLQAVKTDFLTENSVYVSRSKLTQGF